MGWAVPHWTLLCSGILSGSRMPHSIWSLWNALIHWPDDWIYGNLRLEYWIFVKKIERTLIAMVRITVITSNEPFSTQLSGRDGSYSQMAVDVSTAAIFVMCVITLTSVRLMTWPKQLYWSLGKKVQLVGNLGDLRELVLLCRPHRKMSTFKGSLNSFTFHSITWGIFECESVKLLKCQMSSEMEQCLFLL